MLALLLESALRSLALGIVVWLGVRGLRLRDPHTLRMVWGMVLGASLMMPVLVVRPIITVPAPAMPALLAADGVPSIEPALTPTPVPPIDIRSKPRPAPVDWLAVATAAYLAVAGLMLARLALGLAVTWRMVRSAQPVEARWASAFKVRFGPAITAPATFGSTILLPADAGTWPEAKRFAVLMHERAHAANWDFHEQLLASINRAIFWINPLAWWLRDNLITLAEMTADDVVLGLVDDRPAYAEILFEVGSAGRAAPTGVAMARPPSLGARIERILAETVASDGLKPRSRRLAFIAVWPVILAASCVTPRPAPQSFTPVSIDTMGGTIDGRALPRDTSVTVENWAAGVIDAQAVPADWPQRITLNFQGQRRQAEPWARLGPRSALVDGKIDGDHLLFCKNDKYYYVDDPALLARAASLIPDIPGELRALNAEAGTLFLQIKSREKVIAPLDAQIAAAATPAARSPLIQQKIDLAREQALLAKRMSEIDSQRAAFVKRQKAQSAETAEEIAHRYEALRSLIDDAWRKGLTKPSDAFAIEPNQPSFQGDDAAIAVSGNMLSSAIPAKEAQLVRAWQLRGKIQGDYVWFQHRFRFYYVTDPETVRKVEASIQAQRGRNRQNNEHNMQAMKDYLQKVSARNAEQIALADREDRIHADMAAASTPDARDRLAKQETAMLEQQKEIDPPLRPQLESPPPLGDTPSVHALLQAAYDAGLTQKIDP